MQNKTPIITPATATTNVSTLTPLTSWLPMQRYGRALFVVQNASGSDDVFAVVETSEDGTIADGQTWEQVAVAGKAASIYIEDSARSYFRLSAHSTEPSYPTVAVRFSVTGWLDW